MRRARTLSAETSATAPGSQSLSYKSLRILPPNRMPRRPLYSACLKAPTTHAKTYGFSGQMKLQPVGQTKRSWTEAVGERSARARSRRKPPGHGAAAIMPSVLFPGYRPRAARAAAARGMTALGSGTSFVGLVTGSTIRSLADLACLVRPLRRQQRRQARGHMPGLAMQRGGIALSFVAPLRCARRVSSPPAARPRLLALRELHIRVQSLGDWLLSVHREAGRS